MQRIPLRRGTSVAIDGKSYVIGDVIGEGGFSYIYATEPGSGTDVVIKEYYPASGALRDERTQRVLPAPGQETVFQQNLERLIVCLLQQGANLSVDLCRGLVGVVACRSAAATEVVAA